MSNSKLKLNKKIIFFGLLAFVAFALVIIFSLLGYDNKEIKQKNKYSLSLVYDETEHALSGRQRVEYVNTSENMFTSIYFHLYPNAFRSDSSASVVSANNVGEAYPNGMSYGKIEIINVAHADGQTAEYQITGEDQNILAVSCGELFPDESITLEIQFKTTLANITHRLGYGDSTINFGNFYPIACVYEDGAGFSQSLYHSNGDPFYSDTSDYNVQITFPEKYSIASSGNMDLSSSGGGKTAKIKAKDVRDFCFVLSQKFEKVSEKVDGTQVNYFGYSGDDNLEESLQTCVDALEYFNETFGKYPYSQLSVVKSNFVHGGMEFPNIVLISDMVKNQADYNYVIIHEIAHQWWYGLIGNDEYNHAWMDEGLAEYSTLLFFRDNETYGEDFESLISASTESYKLFEDVFIRVTGSVDGRMDRPLCDFATEPEYVQCTYTKGTIMFATLHEVVGEKRFISALQEYFDTFCHQNASPEDMIAIFVKKCGREMEGFFESFLQGKVVIK